MNIYSQEGPCPAGVDRAGNRWSGEEVESQLGQERELSEGSGSAVYKLYNLEHVAWTP